jgi:hypothetical protein
VSAARSAQRSERKALLAIRAELDRTLVTLAAYEVRMIVLPPTANRFASARPLAAMFVGLGGTFLGMPRLGRWLRVASLALTATRIARSWRRRAL